MKVGISMFIAATLERRMINQEIKHMVTIQKLKLQGDYNLTYSSD